MISNIGGSFVARSLRSDINASEESIKNYAYALLMIAGGDDISENELDWLMDEYFGVITLSPNKYREEFTSANYKHLSLNTVIDKIDLNLPFDFKLALLYDSLKMSYADENLSMDEIFEFRKAAILLKISSNASRMIEGLVKTERSLQLMAKSLFEADTTNKHTSGQGHLDAHSLLRYTYGYNSAPDQFQLAYGKALLSVAGADEEVSQKEKDWLFYEFLPAVKASPQVVDELQDFDGVAHRTALGNFIAELNVYSTEINFSKTVLYNAIRMAQADKDYAAAEKAAVRKAAMKLGIPVETAKTIEYLIQTENNVLDMRNVIFGQVS